MFRSLWRYLSSLGGMSTTPGPDTPLRRLVWEAYALFSHPPSFQTLDNPAFRTAFQALQSSLAQLQLGDLGLDEGRLEAWRDKGRAPVLYMSVVDAEATEKAAPPQPHPPPNSPAPAAKDPANVMTVAAFIVKPGARLPLHNHPKMYGILRVLHGQLTVQTYSSVGPLTSRPGADNTPAGLLARKGPMQVVTPACAPLVLSRHNDDIHEITNDTPTMAIFLDVLAPPYDFRKCDPDDDDCNKGHREISFYQEKGPASPDDLTAARQADGRDYVILEEIPCPDSFTTDHVDYSGPSLL
ncbi:2-aminoethanethiol dioxygenase-like [Paramacrobiotus metropolitanus]|uniref:2-aminoethanethiol dioxygenase-like n=1 Tax=Paramacrobiotus metropolitanus TaxID=2943436 RepID=UPI0024463528|nr:2-aminoethanethiol dioxygenase-like [Paramacrobiotus metropolitanus]